MPGEKIRVLIVDDVSETRENVRKLLQFESDVEVVGAARTGKEGIQLSNELNPDVVLMDINMPDIDCISATEIIRQKSPYIQVVILSVQGDQNYMRRAMLAGARDFLTKPPTGDDLISAIRRAGEMSRAERSKGVQNYGGSSTGGSAAGSVALTQISEGKIVLVYSPKGGTGCTTIAVNLALALHNEDTRAVLVDCNLQFGDVAVFINESGKNTILDITQRPELAERVSADQLVKVLQHLRRIFAYVVIDTSPILTDIILSAIDASDVIVLVATQEIPAIKNSRLFLDLLQTMGIDKQRILFVMNRYDKRIAITSDRLGENLKQEVSTVIPMDEKVVIPSVNRGVPFMLDNKTQPVARGIFSLAESVRARLTAIEAESEMAGKR